MTARTTVPVGPRPGEQVTFEAQCACGERHTMTGWQSATPGLVVWQENSTQNDPHPQDDYYPKDQEFWSLWHQPSNTGILMGFADPESAMRDAADLGRNRRTLTPQHDRQPRDQRARPGDGPCAHCGGHANACRHLVTKYGLAGCCGACATGDTHPPANSAEARS